MAEKHNKRIISTPSTYAKENYFYVQEIGTLTSQSPHISTRNNLFSFLFMVVVNGSGTFTYHNEIRTLQTGDIVFINCEDPYSHESSENDPWTLTWVHFYGRNLKSIYNRFIELEKDFIMHPFSVNEVMDTLSKIYDTLSKNDGLHEILANKYLTDLVTYALVFENEANSNSNILYEKLNSVRAYLKNNYNHKITLNELSEMFYISKYHLDREYKNLFGITIVGDLNSIRISEAKSLLRFTSDPIEVISNKCGFKESGYFIKVFKSSEGLTPLAYRKKW